MNCKVVKKKEAESLHTLLWGGITSSRRIDGSSLKISLPHDSTGRQNSRPPSFHSPSGAHRFITVSISSVQVRKKKKPRAKREIPFSLTKMDGKATELWRRRHLECRKSRAVCNQATKQKKKEEEKKASQHLNFLMMGCKAYQNVAQTQDQILSCHVRPQHLLQRHNSFCYHAH